MPQIVHGVHGYWKDEEKIEVEDRLAAHLSAHSEVVYRFDELPLMRFNPDDAFDENGRLRADAESVTPFIKQF
jgi:NAD(P)H dehydrogenase (quinone)